MHHEVQCSSMEPFASSADLVKAFFNIPVAGNEEKNYTNVVSNVTQMSDTKISKRMSAEEDSSDSDEEFITPIRKREPKNFSVYFFQ